MSIGDWSADVCSSDLSAITGALLDRARATLGCDFAQLYGMTETTGAGTVLSPEEHDRSGKAGSCGRAWPGLKIVVIDEAGYELPQIGRASCRERVCQ